MHHLYRKTKSSEFNSNNDEVSPSDVIGQKLQHIVAESHRWILPPKYLPGFLIQSATIGLKNLSEERVSIIIDARVSIIIHVKSQGNKELVNMNYVILK